MNNFQLENELKTLVAQERELLHEILLRIREVESRKLYLERGYSSLFDYLTREIGYSCASAQRRIDTVRLSREIPEVIEKVRDGALNLSQIGHAQKGFRRKEISKEEKQSLLDKLAEAPSSQAEAIVAKTLDLPVEVKTKVKPQSDGSVRLELTLSEDGHRDLLRVKELLSHSIPKGELGAVLERALRFYLEKKESKSTSAAEVAPQQKTVPAHVRRLVFKRDKVCQFKADDGRICGSRHLLQLDHMQMRFYGGTNEPENLRLLCRPHNLWVAQQTMKGEAAR
ncbi:MAG: HNH endonuclease [Bdellovibrionota bacterium]